jgi:Hepatocellular carcinoma-associated antigen 59
VNILGLIVLILGYTQKENPYEVGTQFSKETHIRDEDDEMRKFIETEMEKLKVRNIT